MNSSAASFTTKSPLYWLCGAVALGIALVGLLALFAPVSASAMFGMPATATESLPWVRLAGIRDIALGLILFAIVVLKEGRLAGILMLVCLVVPITDVTTVFLRAGLSYHMFIHGSSAIFMAIVGLLLLREK